VPLSKLRGEIRTRIEDLRTVCANCHRMLHRMDGERGDFGKLRRLVRTARGRKRPVRRRGA
jgi:predicted HNH restriction endonuclease